MGRRILLLAKESDRFDIVAAIERSGHPDIGKDAGLVATAAAIGVSLSSEFPPADPSTALRACPELAEGACVAIDFSQPEAANKTIDYCAGNGVALLLGTTGLSTQQQGKIRAASEKIPILYATNMSVGMNVLFFLAGKVAAMLGEEYDIEIIEQHHRFKKDAPSGSALTLAESICKATGRDFPVCLTHGRSGKDALRQKGTIGMHAIRAGDITGEHEVIFSTLGETVTLSHSAHSRDTFARGALRAAEWLVGKKPALYSMADVLGIK
jgi:4-hydroxy-tetrahydrodipicolinate reductase